MRIQISQHGEAVHRFHIAAAESFGRIGRQEPLALAWMSAGGQSGGREAVTVHDRRFALELHAAARANRSHRVGGLVVRFARFVADKTRRLMAGASSNFPFFQPKE